MGSWGPDTFQNDNAQDFMVGVTDKLAKTCRRMLNKKHVAPKSKRGGIGRQFYYDEARAAAITLSTLFKAGAPVSVEDLDDAQKVIAVMLDDQEWIGQWRTPATIKRSLESDLANVRWALHRAKANLPK